MRVVFATRAVARKPQIQQAASNSCLQALDTMDSARLLFRVCKKYAEQIENWLWGDGIRDALFFVLIETRSAHHESGEKILQKLLEEVAEGSDTSACRVPRDGLGVVTL